MKKTILIMGLLIGIVSTEAQVVSLNGREIQALRKTELHNKTLDPFIATAERALDESPNPIEEITSEGLLAGNPAKTASLKAVEDAHKVYCLSLVYRLFDRQACLAKAIDILLAWSRINKASGDPIDETKLEDMITGYDLIRSNLPREQKDTIDQWLNSVAEAETNSASAKPGRGTAINNWNSHRIKIITLIAFTIHAPQYDTIIRTELEKQLAVNLNPDGTTLDFMERDAFHYHTYDLEPLLTTCIVIYRGSGKDYFDYQTPRGASIKKSVDFMLPYMTGKKQHQEFVNSTVPFDGQRARNHEKGFEAGTMFDPKNGLGVLSLAAYFEPGYIPVIKQVGGEGDASSNWKLILNNVRAKKPR